MPGFTALEGNLLLLQQGLDLLERLSDADYRDHAIDRSAVGAQYRHILDHYRCLLDGLHEGEVDFDRRHRDPVVETERAAACRATTELLDRLRLLSGFPPGRPIRIRQSTGAEGSDDPQSSSLGRELLFLVSHTVHHYAIIRLLLEERGVVCQPDLGVAPSTLAFRQATG